MTVAEAGLARRPGRLRRALRAVATLAVGTLLCLHPLTAVIALGWVTRGMAARIEGLYRAPAERPGWVLGPRGSGRVVRALGGLGANIRAGFGAAAALVLFLLPASLLWLGAWWAGWENSFNKGYEQAWVGPSVFLTGLALGAVLIAWAPLAHAHLAAEGRRAAAFEARRLWQVMAHAGWRMPALAALTLLLALPLFAARGWPAFAGEAMAVESLTPAEVEALRGRLALAAAAWAFAALVILRHLAVGIYARAAARAAGADPVLWARSRARLAASPARPPAWPLRALWLVLTLALSTGLGLLILVAQFLNYGWWHWLTHPFLVLPWPG